MCLPEHHNVTSYILLYYYIFINFELEHFPTLTNKEESAELVKVIRYGL